MDCSKIKRSFKCCAACNYKPQNELEVSFGILSENEKKWYCDRHIKVLWKSVNKNINNISDWWDYLDELEENKKKLKPYT